MKAPKALRRFVQRLSASATGRHDETRLREELDAHIQLQTEENIRAGMPPDEARRQAVLKFGSLEAARESVRDEQRLPAFDDIVQDVRYTFRQLRKAPLFALTAILSLAAGIGANAGVFTVVERVLLRSLPVSKPHELVYVTDERILTQASPRFSYPFYAVVRDNAVLDGVAARAATGITITVNGQAVKANGELVSGNYFSVLGAGMTAGRPLTAEDDRVPGAHPLAVISELFWRRTFNSDPSLVGRSVMLSGQTFTIVGVAGKGFVGPDVGSPTDIWVPLAMQRELGRNLLTEVRTNWLEMIGRLRPGQRREQVAEALTRDFQQRASVLPPERAKTRLVLVAGGKGSATGRGDLRSALRVLLGLTGLALALACVNVACLAAVRAAGREKEIAIRLAIGARRSRVERQLLTEGLVLAALGGAAAVVVAPWTARYAAAQSISLQIEPDLGITVLAFVVAVSLLAGFIVALVPILASRNVGLVQGAEGSYTSVATQSRRFAAHDAIVSLQIAMALAMLISAGLLVQSLRSLTSLDPGFIADHVLLASLDPRSAGYDSNRIDGFWRSTLEQVRRVPGVEHVTLAGTVPLAPGRQRQPWDNPASGEKIEIDTNTVGPRYFQTLGIALAGGRAFTENDGRASQPVVIVNERLARLFWPQQDPIGKGLRLPGQKSGPNAEVVGVVRDVKYRDLRSDAGPMIYRPVLQSRSTDAMTLHVRAAMDPAMLATAIRAAMQNVDRSVPLFQIRTLEEQMDSSFAQTRQAAALTGAFGLLALLLSGVGVYGVTALAVSRRTRDIGIRMALGAQRFDIINAVGGRIVVLIGIGLVLGLLGAAGSARMTQTLVFGVTVGDAATLISMTLLLAIASLIAFAIPVRRATRMDALAAIRHE